MMPGKHCLFNFFLLCCLLNAAIVMAQGKSQAPYRSQVWVSDQGNGTYKNPVLNADYSDPDAIRVGDDYYMVSSSFEDAPGLPVLHSKDLVNWRLIGHALPRLLPDDHFSVPRHGEGVWAPSLRHHNGEFFLYYPDPDFGIYLIKAKNAAGPWSQPVLVAAGKGLIDPCPLWDDDGKVWLAHAFAGSRAGIKSMLAVKRLNAAGDKAIDAGVLVYDGHDTDPTIEGPKFYKRNGYYYLFAPAGGVATGWQLVLRSKNIYGPYERKIVMDQGTSSVNGPHQGAWVRTQTGEDWFLHFQDKEAFGRVVHLQPMFWKNDWPVIGADVDGDGKGTPVMLHRKPNTGAVFPVVTPPESDEFDGAALGLQWQWMSNPKPYWAYANPATGMLRLFSDKIPAGANNLWEAGQLLSQKIPADSFMATVKLRFMPNSKGLGERAGLVVMGLSYAGLAIKQSGSGFQLVHISAADAGKGGKETETLIGAAEGKDIYFRVRVSKSGSCRFQYSSDGKEFRDGGAPFTATVGKWKGAKLGLFCTRTETTNDSGWADVDWFRVTALSKE